MSTVPYCDWVEYLETLLKEINYHPRIILDLACGTGNMTLLLAKRGYKMLGIDGSKEMVKVAQKKAEQKKLDVSFSQGDFRTFQLKEPVDLVISLYDSLNYLLTEEDLELTFKQVNKALNPYAYFIFDMNTVWRLTNIEEGNSMFEGDGYYCFWRDEVDKAGPYWKVYLTFFIENPDGSMWRKDEIHVERAYPITTISKLLVKTGFRVEQVYDAFTLNPGNDKSERIYFVAKKVESVVLD
ncbi:hypothetical protein BBF96_08220 [Anoxybacter fermentans]|uniref:Methyltransferase domain-containing protein n=2 Tax=Anoxybacter fermentans TaxID=1323375 RepID=A0A3Q9HSN6_9FIRM|nr:hypothetical protein BBF96_08220 [Anoxybacter fermentans]